MDTKDILMLGFLVPILFLISRIREELHWVEPSTRMKVGIAILGGSILFFLATLKFLPRPDGAEVETIHLALLMAIWSSIAGGVILSTMLIISAAFQLLKRWNYRRRTGS